MNDIEENIKPQRGMLVRLTHRPGIWQCIDKSPNRGGWWMQAWDEEAKASGHWSDEATYREMRARGQA